MRLSYFSKQPVDSLRQLSLEQPLAILGRPHQVVRRITGPMRSSSLHPPAILLTPSSLGWASSLPQDRSFLPATCGGASRAGFVTSCVPPKLIPQFANAEGVTRRALGVHKLNFVMLVSRTHNLKNVRHEPEESAADFKTIVAMAHGTRGARTSVPRWGAACAASMRHWPD